jgi:hypothetical protein
MRSVHVGFPVDPRARDLIERIAEAKGTTPTKWMRDHIFLAIGDVQAKDPVLWDQVKGDLNSPWEVCQMKKRGRPKKDWATEA